MLLHPLDLKPCRVCRRLIPTKIEQGCANYVFGITYASGLTLIPVSIIAVVLQMDRTIPMRFYSTYADNFVCTLTAMVVTSCPNKINLFNADCFLPVAGLSLTLSLFVWFLSNTDNHFALLISFSDAFSNGSSYWCFWNRTGGLYKKNQSLMLLLMAQRGLLKQPFVLFLTWCFAVSMLRTSGAF